MSRLDLPAVDDESISFTDLLSDQPLPDFPTDYGVPTILFFSTLPSVPDDLKGEVLELVSDIQSWNAWEVAQAERQVGVQIDNGKLLSDDSVESRLKRANYRVKVVDYLRASKEALWLKMTERKAQTNPIDVEKEKVPTTIRNILAEYFGASKQYAFLSTISNEIAVDPEKLQFFWTDLFLKFDEEGKPVVPELQETFMTWERNAANDDKIHISTSFVKKRYELDIETWRKESEKVPDIIKSGKKILNRCTIEFSDSTKDEPVVRLH